MLGILIEVPLADNPTFITKDNRTLIRVQGCTINRFVIFMLLHYIFTFNIEYTQSTIFTGCIDQLLFLAKTADCIHISFEGRLERTYWGRRFRNIKYFDSVIHANHYFIFTICDLETYWSRVELDGLSRITVAVGRIPETNCVVVGTTC